MDNLPPDLLSAMAIACAKCWEAANPPPPASALYLVDDWKWNLGWVIRGESSVLALAAEAGYGGTMEELRYLAHREAYAQSGDDADLAKMLGHVTMATDAA